jgi:hypothetical protein
VTNWRLVVNLVFLLLLLLAALRYRLDRATDDELRRRGVTRQLTLGGAGIFVWFLPSLGLARFTRACEFVGAVLVLAALWWLAPTESGRTTEG